MLNRYTILRIPESITENHLQATTARPHFRKRFTTQFALQRRGIKQKNTKKSNASLLTVPKVGFHIQNVILCI